MPLERIKTEKNNLIERGCCRRPWSRLLLVAVACGPSLGGAVGRAGWLAWRGPGGHGGQVCMPLARAVFQVAEFRKLCLRLAIIIIS